MAHHIIAAAASCSWAAVAQAPVARQYTRYTSMCLPRVRSLQRECSRYVCRLVATAASLHGPLYGFRRDGWPHGADTRVSATPGRAQSRQCALANNHARSRPARAAGHQHSRFHLRLCPRQGLRIVRTGPAARADRSHRPCRRPSTAYIARVKCARRELPREAGCSPSP